MRIVEEVDVVLVFFGPRGPADRKKFQTLFLKNEFFKEFARVTREPLRLRRLEDILVMEPQ